MTGVVRRFVIQPSAHAMAALARHEQHQRHHAGRGHKLGMKKSGILSGAKELLPQQFPGETANAGDQEKEILYHAQNDTLVDVAIPSY